MKLFEYTAADAQAGRCPFGDAYADDLWVVYHGTSDHAEALIEQEGFVWADNSYSQADCLAVLQVFNELRWVGSRSGGAAVLMGFTRGDFARGGGQRKPVYFGETSFRALDSTSRDWAGGETARALRYAFDDLREYADSKDFRRQALWQSWRDLRGVLGAGVPPECVPASDTEASFHHLRALWQYYGRLGIKPLCIPGLPPTEPVNFSETWLGARLAQLAPLEQRCRTLFQSYKYGVIYAVRFEESDLDRDDLGITYSTMGGLAVSGTLHPDRIVAKACVAPDVDYYRLALQFRGPGGSNKDSAGRLRAGTGNGIIGRVHARQRGR